MSPLAFLTFALTLFTWGLLAAATGAMWQESQAVRGWFRALAWANGVGAYLVSLVAVAMGLFILLALLASLGGDPFLLPASTPFARDGFGTLLPVYGGLCGCALLGMRWRQSVITGFDPAARAEMRARKTAPRIDGPLGSVMEGLLDVRLPGTQSAEASLVISLILILFTLLTLPTDRLILWASRRSAESFG